jgi:hypothetical protein
MPAGGCDSHGKAPAPAGRCQRRFGGVYGRTGGPVDAWGRSGCAARRSLGRLDGCCELKGRRGVDTVRVRVTHSHDRREPRAASDSRTLRRQSGGSLFAHSRRSGAVLSAGSLAAAPGVRRPIFPLGSPKPQSPIAATAFISGPPAVAWGPIIPPGIVVSRQGGRGRAPPGRSRFRRRRTPARTGRPRYRRWMVPTSRPQP